MLLLLKEQINDEIFKYCTQAKDVLKIIEKTHELGIKPNYVENGKTSKNKKRTKAGYFNFFKILFKNTQ